jgi:hypothetical protein
MPMAMTGGVSASANTTYYGVVEIRINGLLGNHSFTTFAGFTTGLDAQGIGLLGGVGFFEKYPTVFDLPNNLFHIDVP